MNPRKPSEQQLPRGVWGLRIILDEPTPPYPEISQELLDDPCFQMMAVGNPVVYTAPYDILNEEPTK
jgi:hypothetical protein